MVSDENARMLAREWCVELGLNPDRVVQMHLHETRAPILNTENDNFLTQRPQYERYICRAHEALALQQAMPRFLLRA